MQQIKNMAIFRKAIFFAIIMSAWNIFFSARTSDAQSFVPALIAFGDSSVDVGNNNYLPSFYKANYPPYGRDFSSHRPTGRFCNGKLVIDMTADSLAFAAYPPAYRSPQASGEALLIGTNFASAAAGYDDQTANLNHAISLSQQLKYFQEYIKKLEIIAGKEKAASIIKDALYVLSFGTADFNQNYYINPSLKNRYTPDQYSSFLVAKFSGFVKDLHRLGARKIGVTSLSPLGCLPAVKTLYGSSPQGGCVAKHNYDAQEFNKKLNSAAALLPKQLPGLKIAVFDIYKPLYDIVKTPSNYGFKEASRGCCGTGNVQDTAYLCNKKLAAGTCKNATEFVFWDGVHPSEAANRIIANSLISQGISLIF